MSFVMFRIVIEQKHPPSDLDNYSYVSVMVRYKHTFFGVFQTKHFRYDQSVMPETITHLRSTTRKKSDIRTESREKITAYCGECGL